MDPRATRNLLCVCLDGVGAVLRSATALAALKAAAPGRRLTLLASPAGAEAAALLACIDATIPYRAPWLEGPVPASAVANLGLRYALELQGFDGAVILDGVPGPAATLCEAARIPVLPFEPPAMQPLVELRIAPAARSRMRLKFEEAGLDSRAPYIVLHAVGRRRWLPERFADAARQLSLALDQQVIVTGVAAERAACQDVRRGCGPLARCLAGQLTLAELAAATLGATFVLANRSAVAHLARVMRTPLVELTDEAAPESATAGRVRPLDASVEDVVRAACDLWLDIHWRAAA